MITLDQLVGRLTSGKTISFSFLSVAGVRLSVTVRECEDYDLEEYGDEYAAGDVFEVGPAHASASVTHTQLVFEDIHAAGQAVLKLRADRHDA